ncbi:hypothetical protein NL676_008901 [Syzygium grande]|nr:hypothetical protein NL676_008901 [Syzygium grande]
MEAEDTKSAIKQRKHQAALHESNTIQLGLEAAKQDSEDQNRKTPNSPKNIIETVKAPKDQSLVDGRGLLSKEDGFKPMPRTPKDSRQQ